MVSYRTLLTSALALSAPVAAQSSAQIVSDLGTLTQKSSALQPEADSINAVNGVLLVIGQGPYTNIIRGLTDIITTATTALGQQDQSTLPAGAESDAVATAFDQFVSTHTTLLNTLTQKAALFSVAPFIGAPVTQILRADGNVLDAYSFALIDKVPSRAADITADGATLRTASDNAVDAYSGLNTGGARKLRFARRDTIAAA